MNYEIAQMQNKTEKTRRNCHVRSSESIWRKAGYQSFIRNGVVQLVGASRFLDQLHFFAEAVEDFPALYGKTFGLWAPGSGL